MNLAGKSAVARHWCQCTLAIMATVNFIRSGAADASHSATRRERVSIDLRGHSPALHAISQSMHRPVAALVRTVVGEWLQARSAAGVGPAGAQAQPEADVIKVTLRMPVGHAVRLARAARAAELSQGVYVARLIDGLPPIPVPPDQRENRSALIRSTATLAALSGDLQVLLRMLDKPLPREESLCADTVACLSEAVQRHLATAAPLMAALKPSRLHRTDSPD